MNDAARFATVLANLPLMYGDVLAVLSGDGTVRLDVALGALRQGAAHHVLVMGGVDNPPHSLTADEQARYLIGHGLAPDRIVREPDSQNTHEQAEQLARLCDAMAWGRVLLATSPYHMPRAFLTCLRELQRAGLTERVHLVPLSASQAPWTGCPDGLSTTRADLLTDELRKIDEYCARDHVAAYEDGLAYLLQWQSRA